MPLFHLARSGLCCPNKKIHHDYWSSHFVLRFKWEVIIFLLITDTNISRNVFIVIFVLNALFTRESQGEGASLKVEGKWGNKLQKWTGEWVARLKVCGRNLQTMTEKGEIFKNYHTKMGLLESKLSKNILVDCTFINSMQTIPLTKFMQNNFKVLPLIYNAGA